MPLGYIFVNFEASQKASNLRNLPKIIAKG